VFSKQVEFLASEFDVVAIDEGIRRLRSDSLGTPTACITFDDGYENNKAIAFPILERLRLHSTIYLTTGFIGTAHRLWTTELTGRFRNSVGRSVDLAVVGMGRRVVLDSTAKAISTARAAIETLKSMEWERRHAAVRTLCDSLSETGEIRDEFKFLSWADVRALADTGLVSFGAHTETHEIVSRLPDEQLDAEIGRSIRTVDAEVPRLAISKTFAYPNGRSQDFDERAERVLKDHQIEFAVTTVPGLNSRQNHGTRLRRLVVGAQTPFNRFVWNASGIDGPIATRIAGFAS
jgi:peptidoglycan/xylan/chitin deacetylase (PgdA/CDA1 family)